MTNVFFLKPHLQSEGRLSANSCDDQIAKLRETSGNRESAESNGQVRRDGGPEG